MELEFDKEIDALMRKGLAGRLSTGEVLNAHLDADELSAFAENAMPERSRALYMAHLADCDRCRRILSNLIVLNSEEIAGTAAVAAPAISVAAEPWY
ncbi:MAG TPA: zf-HC2 domain-containing protein, partial [Pyrinomonadaceae bacterium]|nr:zf-HC2 domain-containing protein [Pyrinomonadaceae bacterium]